MDGVRKPIVALPADLCRDWSGNGDGIVPGGFPSPPFVPVIVPPSQALPTIRGIPWRQWKDEGNRPYGMVAAVINACFFARVRHLIRYSRFMASNRSAMTSR